MNDEAISTYLTDTFAGVETAITFGYTFFFCGSERKLPFATLASSDNEYDAVSQLDRPGVFRLNIGVSRETFRALFGAEKIEPGDYDFTDLDRIMPHPVYAAQSFVCVLNPGDATLEKVKLLLAEAYAIAGLRQARLDVKKPQDNKP